jgi:hypothetical protein
MRPFIYRPSIVSGMLQQLHRIAMSQSACSIRSDLFYVAVLTGRFSAALQRAAAVSRASTQLLLSDSSLFSTGTAVA